MMVRERVLLVKSAARFAVAAAAAGFWCAVPAVAAAESVRLEVEGAAAWQTRNRFAVPGDQGTRVDVEREGEDPVAAARVVLLVHLGERWSLRALAAPLAVTTTFVPDAPLRFQDATFAAGVPIEHEYVFNSYRVSVLRRFPWGDGGEWRLGVTAKVRDAKLSLESDDLRRQETDLGVVPLLHGGARIPLGRSTALDLDVDALGAPQGYAVDGTVRILRSLGPAADLFAGYRVLDGGADVDRVYAFATFHYATLGLAFRL